MCSFCLSAATALPPAATPEHSVTPVVDEDSPLSAAALPSLRQIQEQNLAVLKAVEHLGEDRDAALHRYTETITAELTALKEAFALQREQELQTARTSNRIILTVAGVSAGLALLMMLFSAFLPVWAVKRFAASRMAPRPENLFLPRPANIWGSSALPSLNIFTGVPPAISPTSGAIAQLEERLHALEKRASQFPPATPDDGSRARPAGGQISSAPRQPPAKFNKAAHVAITIGAGEAIGFLPRETALSRFDSLRALLGKFKRMFQRPRMR